MGVAANQHKQRQRLRQRLRDRGVPEREITDALERLRFEHLVRRHGLAKARDIVYAEIPEPDDSRYRPSKVDSTLTGSARATGETAKAVRRGRTITKWQHDERNRE